MADYTKLTDFASKDALSTGNPAKIVKGTEINDEFVAIATAIATKHDSSDIGVTVQGYDAGLAYLDGLNFTNEATFKQGVNLEIGVDVQAYDVNTAKYDDATANFTGTLQNGGSNVVTAAYTGDVAITGDIKPTTYQETYATFTSTANAATVDTSTATVFTHVLTESTTLTFSNPPTTGTAYGMTVKIVQDAGASGFTVTWPASVDWPNGSTPSLSTTASAVDVFTFFTHDGGTTWYGVVSGRAMG